MPMPSTFLSGTWGDQKGFSSCHQLLEGFFVFYILEKNLFGAVGVFFLWKHIKRFSSHLFSLLPKESEKKFKRQSNSQWPRPAAWPSHCVWSSRQPLLSSQDRRTHRHPRHIPCLLCLLCAQCGQNLIHFTWETVAGIVCSVSASRCPMSRLLMELSLSSDALLFRHLLFHHCHFH